MHVINWCQSVGNFLSSRMTVVNSSILLLFLSIHLYRHRKNFQGRLKFFAVNQQDSSKNFGLEPTSKSAFCRLVYENIWTCFLQEARRTFRELLCESSVKIDRLAKNLGACIDKSRPYYDARFKAKEVRKGVMFRCPFWKHWNDKYNFFFLRHWGMRRRRLSGLSEQTDNTQLPKKWFIWRKKAWKRKEDASTMPGRYAIF